MNCNHITSEIMTKFLTGDLSPEEKQNAELHIAVCPECAAKLDEQRRFENDAARSCPRTFSGRLDPKGKKAIDDAVRECLNAPSEISFWIKRIRGTVAIQLGAVAAVALLLLAMILIPSGSKKRTNTETGKAAPSAAIPVQTSATPVKKTAKKASAPVAPAGKAKPETAADTKDEPAPVTEALNKDLIRIFALNEISLRPAKGDTFRHGAVCMESPFEDGVCILLAVCSGDPAEGSAELRIHPEGKTVLLSQLYKSENDGVVSATLFNRKKEDPNFVFVTVFSPENGAAPFRVAGKDVLKSDDAAAPSPLRLAAILHAAGKPRILMKREIREKMITELDLLVKNEYAGDPQTAIFLEKLRKVR